MLQIFSCFYFLLFRCIGLRGCDKIILKISCKFWPARKNLKFGSSFTLGKAEKHTFNLITFYLPLVLVLQDLTEGHQVSIKEQGLQFPEPYKAAAHEYRVSFSKAATGSILGTLLKHSVADLHSLQRQGKKGYCHLSFRVNTSQKQICSGPAAAWKKRLQVPVSVYIY